MYSGSRFFPMSVSTVIVLSLLLALPLTACKPPAQANGASNDIGSKVVRIDGSSTTGPISMIVAEMFKKKHSDIRVPVGISGTGGGFKKFLNNDKSLRSDINDASRTIRQTEIDKASRLGIEYVELPVALDGIAVVVNAKNDFCVHLTVEELKRIWEPDSKINNWSQIREGLPDVPLKLYGPGADSGTFDYFTEAIVGEAKACRTDFTPSEDDNLLVTGIAGERGALGYFGFSYYAANKDKLRVLAIDDGGGKPVLPTLDTIRGGEYAPLSRPLFIYVNRDSLQREEVKQFVTFYFQNAATAVEHRNVKYVALDERVYEANLQKIGAQ